MNKKAPALVSGIALTNLIPNGGFEYGTDSWSGIDASNISPDTTMGSNALKITANGEAQSQVIAVTPGQSYTLTAWYQWKQYSGNEWGYDRIYVENADGLEAASLRDLHSQVAQDTWQKFTLIFVPTGSTVQVNVGQFGPKATVEIYFDNVQMVASTSTATPPPAETSSVTETPTLTTESPTPTPTLPVTPLGQLAQAKYTYDGDGNLVKSEVTSLVNDLPSVTITYFAGKHYNVQVTGEVTKTQKTYSFGSQTVAVRTIQGSQNWLTWILTDNLGSTSVTANADGSFNSEIRYSAFGEIRTGSSGTTPTNYKYTGQLSQPELGLDYYIARWYDRL